jgi:hypothetical protein
MKKKLVFSGLVLIGAVAAVLVFGSLCLIGSSPRAADSQQLPFFFGIPEKTVYSKSDVSSPKSSYQFKPVLQFDQVRHDFIIKNTSDRMLELRKAYGCCGSLVEAYSPQIQPRGQGLVKVLLFTDRRGGHVINGTIHLLTSDPQSPEWTIDISCAVKKFADISDFDIDLSGSWRTPLEGVSTVMPIPAYPFKITSVKAKRGIFIEYGYREITRDGRKGYVIWAKNTRKEPGVIRDTIYIQTTNPSRKQFLIRVEGQLTD